MAPHRQGESPYPHAMPETTDDREPAFDREYVGRLHKQLQAALDDIAQFYVDQTNRVDEYRPQSLSGESLITEFLQPDYECDEIITSVVVTGPAAGQTDQTFASPAPGANFVYTNNTGVPQTVLSASATFTTDATVANRFPGYQIKDAAGNLLAQDVDGSAVLASSTINIRAMQGVTHLNSPSGSVVLDLPLNETIPPGGSFTFAGATAADQFSAIILTFGPVTAYFTLQLGRRAWQLQLPASGILTIAPIQVKLGRSDLRQLIAGVAGDWSFELMGYAETGRRGRV